MASGAEIVNVPRSVQKRARILEIADQSDSWKAPVRVVATSNVSLSGLATTIDGVTLAADDRVLLTGQTAPAENRIMVAKQGTWLAPLDADHPDKLPAGTAVKVQEGTAAAGSTWRLTTTGTIVLGTTSLTWARDGVTGPASSTDGRVATFSGTSGKVIQDGGVLLSSLATTASVAAGYQPLDADLTALAAITPGAATVLGVPVGGSAVAALTAAQIRAITGLGVVDSGDWTSSPSSVVNTTTQTTFMTVSLPAVVAGDRFHLVATGDLRNQSGGSVNFTLQTLFGSTSIGSNPASAQGSSASRGAWDLDMYVTCPATNRQVVSGRFSLLPTGTSSNLATATSYYPDARNMTADLSSASSWLWKITMSVADATVDWRTFCYTLTRER